MKKILVYFSIIFSAFILAFLLVYLLKNNFEKKVYTNKSQNILENKQLELISTKKEEKSLKISADRKLEKTGEIFQNTEKKRDVQFIEKKAEKKIKENLVKNKKIFFEKQEASKEFLETENKNLLPYSKENFLPYWYIPKNLIKVAKVFSFNGREYFLIKEAEKDLEKMLQDAKTEGLEIKIRSAYRSYTIQEMIKKDKIKKRGLEHANKYSADPGQSEHQLGTTVDLTAKSVNYSLSKNFENTLESKWLSKNAQKYGFKLSYPKDNGFYNYEPWHYRWYGK